MENLLHIITYYLFIDKLKSLSGSIVIVCKNRTEIQDLSTHLHKHQIDNLAFGDTKALNRIGKTFNHIDFQLFIFNREIIFAVVNRWIFESERAQQNILLTDDKLIRACSTKYARHIVHFWMPKSLQTFLRRFEVCFSTYEEQLNDALLNDYARNPFKIRSQSILYVNDEWQGFLDIIQLMNFRTECDIPLELRDTLKVFYSLLYLVFFFRKLFTLIFVFQTLLKIEESHNTSRALCKELLTKSVNCNFTCPYRHSLNKDDEQILPKHGFVKMRLLEVLAPNHYAVRIEQHRHSKDEKWQTFNEMGDTFTAFNEWLQQTYSTKTSKFAETIRLGDMYVIKCMPENEYRRCRVLAQNDKTAKVTVYLVDFGQTMTCVPKQLLEMYKQLKVPQPKAIEIILLGIVPADCEREFSEIASKTIKCGFDSMKSPETNTYLSAEIQNAFDSTLLVKDLKLVNIERKESINIVKSLIKIKCAIETPIKLHDIFHEREAKASFENISIDFESSVIAEKPLSENLAPSIIGMDDEMEQFERPASGENLLIDLSDDDQKTEPSELFSDVRVIRSIDDLL